MKLKIEYVKADTPKPWDRNPKKHDLGVIEESMRQFGVLQPILLQRSTDRIVAGHGRYEVMTQRLHLEEVPVVRLDLTDAQSAAYALVDNRSTELGGWDDNVLLDALKDIKLDLPELDMSKLGFADELRDILKGNVVEDEVPEPPKVAKSKRGELYQLGDHRLLCGDATCKEDVEKLMGGEKANLCLTDPPYGVDLDYNKYDDSDSAIRNLAKHWFSIVKSHSDVMVFSCGVTRQWLYPEPDWVLCWFYGGGQFRSPWGFNCWQPLLCYGKDPSLGGGHGCRPDAVDMNTPANAKELNHPCPKPLSLWGWLLNRLSFNDCDVILDPFGGSGTTLIACEQLNRKCYMMEIDEKYCDVIIQRWENATGKKAVKL